MAKYGAKVLLALFILLFVFRPLLKWFYHFAPPPQEDTKALTLEQQTNKKLRKDEEAIISELQRNLPERVEKLQTAFKIEDSEESKEVGALVDAVREIGKKEPKRIAQITHEWLQEEKQP